jgi:hypothetical protein
MADNLALKLLVAGIIGAVIGAAAEGRYHPTGLVYGPFNNRSESRWLPIDPTMGSGNADGYWRPDRPAAGWREDPAPGWNSPPPRYRTPARPPTSRTAWCWKEFEDWDFGTVGHYVPCTPPSAHYGRRPWSL